MLELKRVAVTGGLSCGKSSVCRILKELGAYVVSADNLVHHLLSSGSLNHEIIHLLGPSVVVNRKLDRSRIAHVVFHNLQLLKALEAILHPIVYREIEQEYQKQQNQASPPPLFVAEIPLLFESGGEKDYDIIVAVAASEALCYDRFHQATGLDFEEFKLRTSRQLSPEEKAARAHFVLTNNGTLQELNIKALALFKQLTT